MATGFHVAPLEENSSLVSDLFTAKIKDEDVLIQEDEAEDDGSVYILPDGTRVDIGSTKTGQDLCHLPVSINILFSLVCCSSVCLDFSLCRMQELLFAESLPTCLSNGSDTDTAAMPIHKLVQHSLSQILDADIRKELISNVILTGSSSLFTGMDKRLSSELTRILPNTYKNRVICSKNSIENRYSAWIGGSILSSLGSFQQMWLSKKEYDECGAILGLRKFH